MRKLSHSAVVIALTCGLLASSLAAQPVISVTPSEAPFIGSVSQAVTLTFSIHIEDAQGEPATLQNQTVLNVEIASWEDEDSGLSIASVDLNWTLPQGFGGGHRSVGISISGPPPAKAFAATLSLAYTIGQGEAVSVPVSVSIRAGSPESTHIDFIVPTAKGDGGLLYVNGDGQLLRLFRDFESVRAVGGITAMNADAEAAADAMQLRVVEVVGEEEQPSSAITTSDAEFTAIDADGNGKTEYVQTTFALNAPQILAVAPDTIRTFKLYARRTDLSPAVDIFLADIEVRARERGSGRYIDNAREQQFVSFGRRQSTSLNPIPKLHKNGVLLSDAAQATVGLEPGGGNGQPDDNSGLYDLSWTVVIDWERLKKRTSISAGDIIRVDLTFPGTSVQTIQASCEVLDSGVDFTTFKTLQELENEQYDNNKTEKEYLDELIAALKAAGLTAGGGSVHFPAGFIEDGADDPNWKDIRNSLRALREALESFKNKERKKNGQNQVPGKKDWEIDVFVLIDGQLVRVRIKLGDKEKPVKVNDKDSHPEEAGSEEKKKAPVVVIGLGGDGKDATGSEHGTNGGKAEVKIEGKGNLGIALGGKGGKGGEGNPNPAGKKGGSGGASEVEVDCKKDPQAENGPPGAAGVSMGGHGGDSSGQGGNGGDSKSTAESGSNSKIVAEGGSGGDSKSPPGGSSKGPPQSGSAEVDNKDGAEKAKKAEAAKLKNNGAAGQAVGGMAEGEPQQPSKATGPSFKSGSPITGD